MDRWTGYPAAMERLTAMMAQRATRDTVVLTGDIHTNFAAEVRASYEDLSAPAVAAEFVGSSMSSGGDGSAMWPRGDAMLAANPWLRHHQNRRGYVRCVVTPGEWRSEYRTVPFVERPGAPIATDATWLVRHGDATLQRG
jgi:alkaline phosphatase D